jgi:hypothetical protein
MQDSSFGDDLGLAVNWLRKSVMAFGATSFTLAVGTMGIAFKEPLVIERAPDGSSYPLAGANQERTGAEVHQFVRKALEMAESPKAELVAGFFASEVRAVIEKQRTDLKRDAIEQYLLIHSIEISESQAKVKADRVIAKDELRAAIAENYQVDLREVPRTYQNPYGIEVVGIKSSTQGGKADEFKK